MSFTAGVLFVMAVLAIGFLAWLWLTAELFNEITVVLTALYNLIDDKLTTSNKKQKERNHD